MSKTLIPPSDLESQSDAEFDLVRLLLAEQEQLTAVDEFSTFHDSIESDDAPSQSTYYAKLLPATPPAPGQQYAFQVDLDACSGCKACVVACHNLNGLEDDEVWRRVGTVTHSEVTLPVVDANSRCSSPSAASPTAISQSGVQHVTTACHHCADPGCLKGCPVKAYDKDPKTGLVRHLDDQCIGCMYCTMTCPYEVPQYSKRLGIGRKCDMCHQRLAVGEAPACVQSCPNEAITIAVVEIPSADSHFDTTSIAPGGPSSSITKPTTVYKTKDPIAFDSAVPQDAAIDPVAESHWPLAIMLVATQISVGMLIVERIIAGLSRVAGSPLSVEVTQWNALAALLVGGAGLQIAPLHLGQPLRAWRVFLGLRTSWLSREAVILGKYMGALGVGVILLWLPIFEQYAPKVITDHVPNWAAPATLSAAIVFGFAGVFSSAMIYVATRRHLWRAARTFTRFVGTSIVGGFAGCTAVLAVQTAFDETTATESIVILAIATAAVASGKLIWERSIGLKSTAKMTCRYDSRSQRLAVNKLGPLRRVRHMTTVVAVAAATVTVGMAIAGQDVICAAAAGTLAVSVLGGESAERLLYFTSVVYDRMPGTLK